MFFQMQDVKSPRDLGSQLRVYLMLSKDATNMFLGPVKFSRKRLVTGVGSKEPLRVHVTSMKIENGSKI